MAAGKVKSATGIPKDPAVPLAEVPKNVLMPNNKQSLASNTLQRSKVRATEYSSRVKRSLIAYFPRAAQVQPRPSGCNSTKRDGSEGRQRVQELKERETKIHSSHEKNTITVNKLSELEKALRMKNSEIEDLNKRIALLEAEKNQMCEDMVCVPSLKMEIEAAKAQIEDLQKKRCVEAGERLQKDLETENVELRRLNVELQHHRRELSTKLATAESQIVALSNIVQTDRVIRAETEDSVLRHANEDLRKQVEGLQMNRFSEVEELAHLRWVNASLRYKLSNCKLSSGENLAHNSNDPPVQQGRRQENCDNEGLSSHSSNTSEAEEFDDVSLENFRGLIRVSKISSPNGTFDNLTKNTDNCRFSDFDGGGQQSHSNRTGQRHKHSCSYSLEEFLEHSLQDGKRVSTDITALREEHLGNGGTTKMSLPDRTDSPRVKSDRFDQSSKSLLSKANAIDLPNDISASFRSLSQTPDGQLEKHSAFKDRQRIFLQKVEEAKAENRVTVPKCSEVAKLTPIEVEKRALRTPKPPPKPSLSAAVTDGPAVGFRSVLPPPPPPPPRPGVKGAQPPPPPPPPPKFLAREASTMQRAPEVVEFYHSLMKRDAKKDSSGSGLPDTPDVANARSNMIGEIENRSSHWLAIKTDVETQGDFVRSLISEVRAAVYTNIEDVAAFVKWLDDELSFLVDERAVLKHFDWPERKADAMREAAFGYCDLKKLEYGVSSYEDDLHLSCATSLKKMLALLEKLERSVYSLLRNRDMAIARYKEFQIPSDWMLDTGIVGKIKFASVKLAKKYMKRVAIELESMRNFDKEMTKEFLMLQGVRFAFRVHQFAGGFDAESMCAFEELRNLAHLYHKESQEQ